VGTVVGGWVVDSRHQPTCIIAQNKGPSFLHKELLKKNPFVSSCSFSFLDMQEEKEPDNTT
jgi:hypothetical protein